MKVTYENGWEHMDVHVDLPGTYEENYQIRMLSQSNISGLLKIKASGRDGQSRYTYRVNDGISMEKTFEAKAMKKDDIERFMKDLMETVDDIKEHLLDPDGLVLKPELIFIERGRYRFCYLPVSETEERRPLCISFHEMTEYFVKSIDYQDTSGIILVYKIHKETLKQNYDLKRIIEDSRKEETEWGKERQSSGEKRENLSDNATFLLNTDDDDDDEKENKYQRRTNADILKEEKAGYGPLKKVVNRIKTGRWGQWEDLIMEMDGQE